MKNKHSGSSFDSFLEEEGIKEAVDAVALKRVIAWQLGQAMAKQKETKHAMAAKLHTSRSQLNRLLDPTNVSVSIETISRAATALGKRVDIRMVDVRQAARTSDTRSTIHRPKTRVSVNRGRAVKRAG
jgi:antitoxin HicB